MAVLRSDTFRRIPLAQATRKRSTAARGKKKAATRKTTTRRGASKTTVRKTAPRKKKAARGSAAKTPGKGTRTGNTARARNSKAASRSLANAEAVTYMSRLMREVAGIIAVFAAILAAVSLASFHVTDPGWSHTGSGEAIQNSVGRAGAWFADVSMSLLGFMAWLVPLVLVVSGWMLFNDNRGIAARRQRPWIVFRVVGIVLMLASASGLADLHVGVADGALPQGVFGGGIFGTAVAWRLVPLLDHLGTTLLLLALFFSSLTLAFGTSWIQLIESIGAVITGTFSRLKGGFDQFSEIRSEQQRIREADLQRAEMLRLRDGDADDIDMEHDDGIDEAAIDAAVALVDEDSRAVHGSYAAAAPRRGPIGSFLVGLGGRLRDVVDGLSGDARIRNLGEGRRATVPDALLDGVDPSRAPAGADGGPTAQQPRNRALAEAAKSAMARDRETGARAHAQAQAQADNQRSPLKIVRHQVVDDGIPIISKKVSTGRKAAGADTASTDAEREAAMQRIRASYDASVAGPGDHAAASTTGGVAGGFVAASAVETDPTTAAAVSKLASGAAASSDAPAGIGAAGKGKVNGKADSKAKGKAAGPSSRVSRSSSRPVSVRARSRVCRRTSRVRCVFRACACSRSFPASPPSASRCRTISARSCSSPRW